MQPEVVASVVCTVKAAVIGVNASTQGLNECRASSKQLACQSRGLTAGAFVKREAPVSDPCMSVRDADLSGLLCSVHSRPLIGDRVVAGWGLHTVTRGSVHVCLLLAMAEQV